MPEEVPEDAEPDEDMPVSLDWPLWALLMPLRLELLPVAPVPVLPLRSELPLTLPLPLPVALPAPLWLTSLPVLL